MKQYVQGLKHALRFILTEQKSLFWSLLVMSLVMTARSFFDLYFVKRTTECAESLVKRRITMPEAVPVLIAWLAISLLFALLGQITAYVREIFRLNLTFSYNRELIRSTSEHTAEYFEHYENNRKVMNARDKGSAVLLNYAEAIIQYASALPLLFIYGYYLFQINIPIVLLCLASQLFIVGTAGKRLASLKTMWSRLEPFRLRRQYYAGLFSNKSIHQELHANQSFSLIINKWIKEFDSELHTYIQIGRTYEVKMQLIRLLSNLPYFVIIATTAVEIINGRQTIAYLMLITQLFNDLIGVLEGLHLSAQKNISEQGFLDSFWELREAERADHKVSGRTVSEDIHLDRVSYRYPDARANALNEVSLSIPRHTKLAVIGENGSGKTTLMNLCNGTYIPTEGRLCLPESRPACVFQNAAHFFFTVRENIQIGNGMHSLNDEELWNLLDLVGLSDAVRSMPKGLDTMLGQLDEGTDLSMGQWQKLAIARLFASEDADFWILDEPTAYLDPIAEIELYQEILKRAGDRTVFFVSHRLGFAVHSDLILIMDKGRVSDLGTHEQLYTENSIYREMIDGQRNWTEESAVS